MVQFSFTALTSFFHQKCYLPKARMTIYLLIILSDSFLASLWSLSNQSLLGSEESALLCNQIGANHPTDPFSANLRSSPRAWLQNLDGDNRDVILLSH